MAKYWTPGEVKTRLGQSIGLSRAADIHRIFLRHLTCHLCHSADRHVVAVSPESEIERFREQINQPWNFVPQSSGHLGKRMSDWFRSCFQQTGASAIVLIGADCPLISKEEIGQTFRLLQDQDVVLGPAIDGGYYLIGIRGPWKTEYDEIWQDIPWSTPKVYELTLSRLRKLGLSLAALQEREDVDTIAELTRLRQALELTRPQNTSHDDLAQALDDTLEANA